MLTLEEAKNLQPREILHGPNGERWSVNGKVTRWVRDPDRIRVPLKHGLYTYGSLDNGDFDNGVCSWMTLGEPPTECPCGKPKARCKATVSWITGAGCPDYTPQQGQKGGNA